MTDHESMTLDEASLSPSFTRSPSPMTTTSVLVDYTPRHPSQYSQHSHIPFSIGAYRDRRVQHYQKIAQTSSPHANYMDSPVVRRELGVNPAVIAIDVKRPPEPEFAQPRPKKLEWQIDDFEVGKNIGTGKFGNVYVAREKATKQVVALKILIKQELLDAGIVPFVKREIEIHAHLQHPHILRMYGYFQDAAHLYLVLDYANQGSLYKKLESLGRLEEDLAAKCIAQVVSALDYIHGLGVVHRDIKPENILVDKNGTLKLSDFGWAVLDRQGRRKTFCGTLDYLPPEMVENRPHGPLVDVWAVGVLAYELVVGVPPFEHEDYNDTYRHITRVHYRFPDHVSPHVRDFIQQALQPLGRRSSLKKLLDHPWLQST
ncbi:kinase-like protein [Hesseltinella vesiculosa]|uniref:Aurora kinase n=1 Tax=Hesseltinella vesiculosa TaxID=101127 RepID=A0A1X2GPZ5_9FUNG|nr:kinase-like protein [Hesseltinella vesiculosa]